MIQLEVTTEKKENLMDLLARLYPDLSKNKLKSLLSTHRIMRGGFLTLKDTPLKVGEKISILKKPQFLKDMVIYYVDKDIIVLEKPAYQLSVDADNDPGNSVHSTLKRRYGAVYPVHRLDRETTGVMVFALTRDAKESLKKQFEEKSIEREYVAITEGTFEKEEGTWKSYLTEGGDMKMRVSKEGILAITHYFVEKKLKGNKTFIRCRLETGKKNQIRVHAAFAKHPLIGDSRYGSSKKGAPLMLHAKKLSFTHPKRGKMMHFISPIPKEFHSHIF